MADSKKERPDTYSKAGVDLAREERTVKGIKTWVCKTFGFRQGKIGNVMCDIGSFANMIDMGEYALAFAIDGVGSKVLVAQELGKYDTVGIDCIAMNVNDVICVGSFHHTIAVSQGYTETRGHGDQCARKVDWHEDGQDPH